MDQPSLRLEDGSRVGVIGGGPAGSFFSIFLLDMAARMEVDIQLDIYEPRNFQLPGPGGCNMCGGIISESLVQILAAEGINLPPTVVQRGIDSYFLHMDVGSVRIDTPLQEKRIAAVHRGPGPRDLKEVKWGSFDGHLLDRALDKGARVIQERVVDCRWENGRPLIRTRQGEPQIYDFIAVATGVNSSAHRLFNNQELGYQPPTTSKTFICEYFLGQERINEYLGTSMHVYLLDMPRLEFAALIPKGDYVSICLLGEDIDDDLVHSFLNTPEVRGCFPPDWEMKTTSCHCSPRISIQGAEKPFADRIVFIGDSGVTRLYKDGIGAAYRTAKAAATTAVFQGVSSEDFEAHYWPACQRIQSDNRIGTLVFFITRQIQGLRFARRALLQMTAEEQQRVGSARRMSTVMWDTFTGSAPYREIFLRTLHPAFWIQFLVKLGTSLFSLKSDKNSG